MGKLWGTNGEAQRESTASDDRPHSRSPFGERADPDEHTALLRDSRSRRLDPSDPAVSPYNLLSVRSLRWISIVLLVVALIWWILLLVSTFTTIPGFHARGGGWFSFAYSTLATGILLILLLFYGTPSKSERIILLAVLFFLFTDTIMILAAYPIRNDENWVGIVSVVWCLVITAWAVLCDRVVEYGKHQEEERLTGRRETRHSFLEWCSVFAGVILLAICLAITILFTFSLAIRARDATLAAPGQRYFVDSHRYQVHVHCVGDKSNSRGKSNPTIFLEGGEDPVEGRLEGWVKEAYNSSTIKRYCYWDRPGMAWSDSAPSPASAGRIADALSEALTQANEDGPWILVSHGIGGIYSRVFASRHASDVRGLLLIDTFPESLLHRISSPGRGFMLWVRGVISPLGIDRIISATFMGRHREDRIYGRNAYQKGGQIKAKLQENLVATSSTLHEVLAAKAILPKDTPIAVVSSGKVIKKDKEWNSGQRALTRLSDNLIAWDVVNGADHEVWKNEHGRKLLERRLVQLVNSG